MPSFEGKDVHMISVSLHGVTAPGFAVLCGAWLVHEGDGLVGGFALAAGLLIFAYVHTKQPSR